MGLTLQTRPFANQPAFFWKLVLRQALHSASLGMFSDKSTLAFLERIQPASKPLRPGWLQCRKDYGVYLEQDGSVHVLYPTVFPWSKADQYQLPDDGVVVMMPPQQQMNDSQQPSPCEPVQVSVGPWIISIHVLDSCTIKEQQQQSGKKKDEWDALLETPALASMKDLMRGSFSYYLRVPVVSMDNKNNHNNETTSHENGSETNVVRLVFTKFTKATRPRAWKGFDTKVQETLPLLGMDSSSTRADDGSSTNGPTRVALVQVQFGLSETH